jgi:hypothetical protein
MKKKATQSEVFLAIQAWREAYGIVEDHLEPCGCARMVFDTGGVKQVKCWQHENPYPRTCPCGYNDQLTTQTARAHRLGDMALVEELRAERIAHSQECNDTG